MDDIIIYLFIVYVILYLIQIKISYELFKNEGAVNRLFIGKTKGNSSGLFLSGLDGQPKMMIYVDEKGNPKIQTFNEKGEVKDFIESK